MAIIKGAKIRDKINQCKVFRRCEKNIQALQAFQALKSRERGELLRIASPFPAKKEKHIGVIPQRYDPTENIKTTLRFTVESFSKKFLKGIKHVMNYFPRQLDELKSLRQWVAYRLVWNEKKGKSDKLPINPHTGENAKANDPSTWGSYDEAINFAICQGFFDSRSGGIGFEFANGYCGIDLDNVVLEDGSLKTFAEDIVKTMNSYTEYSPSGKGLHILCKLSESLSNFGTRRRNDEIGLEMYDSGRFFTVTGEVFGGAEVKTVENRQEEARKIYESISRQRE